jgi:hypothetical protein
MTGDLVLELGWQGSTRVTSEQEVTRLCLCVWIISLPASNGRKCSVYFNDNVKFNLPSFFHISFCKVN